MLVFLFGGTAAVFVAAYLIGLCNERERKAKPYLKIQNTKEHCLVTTQVSNEKNFLILVEKEGVAEINVMFNSMVTAEELRLIAGCLMKQADSKELENGTIH